MTLSLLRRHMKRESHYHRVHAIFFFTLLAAWNAGTLVGGISIVLPVLGSLPVCFARFLTEKVPKFSSLTVSPRDSAPFISHRISSITLWAAAFEIPALHATRATSSSFIMSFPSYMKPAGFVGTRRPFLLGSCFFRPVCPYHLTLSCFFVFSPSHTSISLPEPKRRAPFPKTSARKHRLCSVHRAPISSRWRTRRP